MISLPRLVLVTNSAGVERFFREALDTPEAVLQFTAFRSFQDLMQQDWTKAPAGLVLDSLEDGPRNEEMLIALRGDRLLGSVPIMLLAARAWVQDSEGLQQRYAAIRQVAVKPMPVVELTARLQELCRAGMIPDNLNGDGMKQESLYDWINTLPGVCGQFQWSPGGELLEVTDVGAQAISSTMGVALSVGSKLSEKTAFGDLLELTVYGKEKNAAVFAVAMDPLNAADYRTIGLLTVAATDPAQLIQSIRGGKR